MPAYPYNKTPVVDIPWDGPGAEAKLKNPVAQSTAAQVYAWHADAKSPEPKADLKFPHHEVSSNGTPGSANVGGVRNALARLSDSNIPTGDKSGVQAHLQHHLDDFNASRPSKSEDDDGMFMALDAGMFAGRIWAVTEDFAVAMMHGLKVASTFSHDQMGHMMAQVEEKIAAGPLVVGKDTGRGVAVIPLQGIITPKPSLLSMLFGGGGGLSGFTRQLNAAVADPDVSHILLNVDSPGGSVEMVPETAAAIRTAGQAKPIVAQANTQMASAAYWLASQAHEISVTPSGSVGSVGVYKLHQDLSGAHEMRGIKPTLISAGNHKVDGNPFEPISSDALDRAQQDVGDYYGMFVNDVARGRGVDNPGTGGEAFGGGNVDIGKRAVKTGLADKVSTMDETVKRLTSGRARVKMRAESFDGDPDDSVEDDDDDEDEDGKDAASSRRYSSEDKTAMADLMFGFPDHNERQEVANA